MQLKKIFSRVYLCFFVAFSLILLDLLVEITEITECGSGPLLPLCIDAEVEQPSCQTILPAELNQTVDVLFRAQVEAGVDENFLVVLCWALSDMAGVNSAWWTIVGLHLGFRVG